MAAGAGRDPAAQGRILETLRKVPQREAVRAQLRLQRGPEHAALDPRGARGAVHRAHAVHVPQVERDQRPFARASTFASTPPTTELPPPNGTSAAPAPPAQSMTAAPGLIGRIGDDVGRARIVVEHAEHRVLIGFAERVRGAVVAFAGADRRKRGGRREARGAQGQRVQRRPGTVSNASVPNRRW